ncbi:MAG: DarT1-associated NADAR antitoxin family protein [Fusobacteriaceae bacterium]
MERESGDKKLSKRPVFIVSHDSKEFVKEVEIEFTWFPGFAVIQKQRSIQSLHKNFLKEYSENKILEISSKSENELGILLSAFNLMIPRKKGEMSVECAFQGSKVFENGGPYRDIFDLSSREAKKSEKLKKSGELIKFDFYGISWELEPKTLFYDWLYINALSKNSELANQILKYDSFTDIEFNPKKSINNQARAAALYVSLWKRGLLEKALQNHESYREVISILYKISTPLKQLKIL